MNTLVSKYWRSLLSLAFCVFVFLFWYVGYPQALSFTEQFQLFLFDADYFISHLKYPGGFSVYLGEFFAQFFALLQVGAVVMSLLTILVQILIWKLAKREGANEDHYIVSFLPSVILIAVMGDVNVMIGFLVGSILSLFACCVYSALCDKKYIDWILVVLLPLLFYLASSATYVFVGYVILKKFTRTGMTLKTASFAIVVVLYTLAIVVVSYYLSSFPLVRIASGVGYFRYDIEFTASQIIFLGSLIVLPFVMGSIPEAWRIQSRTAEIAIEALLFMAIGYVVISNAFDPVKYRVMKYDYLTRTHKWDAIVAMAEKEEPSSPTEMSAVNFALAMRGELAERIFEFPQRTSEGLLPTFKREPLSCVMTSEIFFRLGMVNTAQRFMFEAQESLPYGQKSGRIMRRLAETNIINGQYAVAQRYLHVLEKTFAYRQWAKKTLAILGDEDKVDSHPLYGEMRKLRVEEDFYYSDTEMDQMLGLLFMRNNSNRMALDYLLSLDMLTLNVEAFMNHLPLISRVRNYGQMPRAYQEVLCYVWSQNHNDFNGMPWNVGLNIKRDFSNFASLYNMNKKAPQLSEGRLGSSFWHFVTSSQD